MFSIIQKISRYSKKFGVIFMATTKTTTTILWPILYNTLVTETHWQKLHYTQVMLLLFPIQSATHGYHCNLS